MSDAPETIWACPCHVDDWNSGNWDLASDGMPDEAKYRRADLPPTPAQIMADPRVKALVDALDRMSDTDPDDGTEWFHDQAHAALAAFTKEPKL